MKKILTIVILVFSALSVNAQFIVETPITGLNQPVDFAFIPGTSKVIITHKLADARIYDMSNNTLVSTFWNFTDSLNNNFERGVLGVCIDPNYAANHYIYIYYVHSVPANSSTNQKIRVVRFTENNNVGTNPFIVFNYNITNTPPGNHFGGIIRFRPSDPNKIYLDIGENASSGNAQVLTNPLGKILRFNKDGTIPTDNPFYDDGNPLTGNDDRIWSYGLRNSIGFCFGPNDSLYESENGANTQDECNIIIKGKNYGWPNCEGFCSPYNPAYKNPMMQWGSSLPALSGILFYTGTQMPTLTGKLIVGSNNTNGNAQLYQCTFNATNDSLVSRTPVIAGYNNLTSIQQGTDGYIYVMKGGYTAVGVIYRFKPDASGVENNGEPVQFTLSQNYPNPFNPTTNIKFEIARGGFTTLKVYDAVGSEITTLLNENKTRGEYEINFDASNYPSGVYFYKLTVGEQSIQKKMVLIK